MIDSVLTILAHLCHLWAATLVVAKFCKINNDVHAWNGQQKRGTTR